MSKAVPRSSGQPTGTGISHAKRTPQRIDFDYLTGLTGKAERELREVEDALVAFIEQERRRESLYAEQEQADVAAMEAKYPALRGEVRL